MKRNSIAMKIGFIFLALVIALFTYKVMERDYQNNAAERLFSASASVYHAALFYEASNHVNEAEFRIFAKGQQSMDKTILSTGYSVIGLDGDVIQCHLTLREPKLPLTADGRPQLPKDICYDEDGREAARQVAEHPKQIFSFVRYNYDAPATLIIRRGVDNNGQLGFVSATFNLEDIIGDSAIAPVCPESDNGSLILCRRPGSITGDKIKFVGNIKIEVWRAILPTVLTIATVIMSLIWLLYSLARYKNVEEEVKATLIDGLTIGKRRQDD